MNQIYVLNNLPLQVVRPDTSVIHIQCKVWELEEKLKDMKQWSKKYPQEESLKILMDQIAQKSKIDLEIYQTHLETFTNANAYTTQEIIELMNIIATVTAMQSYKFIHNGLRPYQIINYLKVLIMQDSFDLQCLDNLKDILKSKHEPRTIYYGYHSAFESFMHWHNRNRYKFSQPLDGSLLSLRSWINYIFRTPSSDVNIAELKHSLQNNILKS